MFEYITIVPGMFYSKLPLYRVVQKSKPLLNYQQTVLNVRTKLVFFS